MTKVLTLVVAATVSLFAASVASGQATVVIQNTDPAGAGFNDPTPAAPIGGNPGTTVGEQRLNVFQAAANVWGAALKSSQTITISAHWADLPCTANSGTLGSAGPSSRFANFGAGVANRWYPAALAESLANADLSTPSGITTEINATFNQKLGQPGCLENLHWYYGLDNNHGSTGEDLFTILLHEFGHGLGFQTFTNASTGAFAGTSTQLPSVWDDFLFDNTAGQSWAQMATNSERAASAKKYGDLVWRGAQVNADVSAAALSSVPKFRINPPAAIAANYQIGFANFGPSVTSTGITAPLVQAIPNDACAAVGSLTGKIAVIDRGNCNFTVKAHNAQNAGALGVIIVDNVSNPTPPGMGGGPDNTITIPTFSVTLADGNTIKAQLGGGVNASLFSDKRPFMYTPTTVSSGSSVSHWDTALTPNQLMEPFSSDDLSHAVRTPQDLTRSLLRDIGWPVNLNLAPTILVEPGSNTAAAVDSVTFLRGPFTVTTPNNFSADGRRRLIIFTTPELPANATIAVSANGIPLTVEGAGVWNALAGTSYIVVVLPALSPSPPDYALTVKVNNVNSTNAPTITIVP